MGFFAVGDFSGSPEILSKKPNPGDISGLQKTCIAQDLYSSGLQKTCLPFRKLRSPI